MDILMEHQTTPRPLPSPENTKKKDRNIHARHGILRVMEIFERSKIVRASDCAVYMDHQSLLTYS
jgi:hypothetical protein